MTTKSRDIAGEMAGEIVGTFTSRGSVYGPPEINFQNIANFWNAWLSARYGTLPGGHLPMFPELDALDVAHMSSLIKKARLANSPDHRDSALDDAVYTLLGAGIAAPAPAPAQVKHPFSSAAVNAAYENASCALPDDAAAMDHSLSACLPARPTNYSASRSVIPPAQSQPE
jgi:hypothetical protein